MITRRRDHVTEPTPGQQGAQEGNYARKLRIASLAAVALAFAACANLPNRDPLTIDVAGIEPLPGEGLELRLAVRIRIQNPNDVPVDYRGAALTLELNDSKLATGVSDRSGSVPRYGETVLEIPITISAFDMARQVIGFINASERNEVRFRVTGKLEGGLLGTRRFADEGTVQLGARTQPEVPGR